jgi:hypothetical protein
LGDNKYLDIIGVCLMISLSDTARESMCDKNTTTEKWKTKEEEEVMTI